MPERKALWHLLVTNGPYGLCHWVVSDNARWVCHESAADRCPMNDARGVSQRGPLFGPFPLSGAHVLTLQFGSSLVDTVTVAILPWPTHVIEFETYRLYIIRCGRLRDGNCSTIEPSRAIVSCTIEQVIDRELYWDVAAALVASIAIAAIGMIFFMAGPLVRKNRKLRRCGSADGGQRYAYECPAPSR